MSTLAAYISKQLTEDLLWREAELAVMRKQLYLAATGGLQERVLLRANVAMVYAHYEGFCKFAVSMYVDAISKLKLKRKDLNFKLATYSLGAFRSVLKDSSSNLEFFEKFLMQFNSILGEIAIFDSKIDTSNLWPSQLMVWLDRLGLDSKEIGELETLLESLVRNRNQIAHGQKLVVASRADFDNLFSAATTAMHKVAIEVVGALDAKSYKLASPSRTVIEHSA